MYKEQIFIPFMEQEDKRPYLYSETEPEILHLELWASLFLKNVNKLDGAPSRAKENSHEDGGTAI